MPSEEQPIAIPAGYPTSLIFVDESGGAADDGVFVIGALKMRRPGQLLRAVRDVRDKTGFEDEFRFSRTSNGKLPAYFAALDCLDSPSVHFAAAIIDTRIFDPWKRKASRWAAQADLTAQVLRGCINRREIVSVCIDHVSTPPNTAFDEMVQRQVNRRFANLSIATATCLDSRSSDGLQMVDLLTGAVAWEYRRKIASTGTPNSHKAKVVNRVKQVLGVSELEGRTARLNVLLLESRSKTRPVSPLRRAQRPAQRLPIARHSSSQRG